MTLRFEPEPLVSEARALLQAEENVKLIARAAPADARAAVGRWIRAFSRGEPCAIEVRAGQPPDLGATRRTLERVAARCAALGPVGRRHAERAEELELEARLAEALGSTRFRPLARQRFGEPAAALAGECDAFVTRVVSQPEEPPRSLHTSDDEADPRSLVRRLEARARELGVRVSVRVAPSQLATAATGDGVVVVRPGVRLSAAAGERIATHELLAHALPRARARLAGMALLRAGTRGSADDEEGRALVVEERAGLLDAARQRELALRHAAALAVVRGADPRDTIARLLGLGASLERAVDLAVRVHRGGGLAREIVYLPAYFKLKRAFAVEPGLERWFEQGRVDLETAAALNRAREAPECDRRASAAAAVPRQSSPA